MHVQQYIHLNPAEQLAPVGCPLVIERNGHMVRAKRTSHVEKRGRQMEYELEDGTKVVGKYRWTYP